MHHKRRSRRLDKRRMARCGCCEIITPAKVPIADGPCMGKAKKKKATPKKKSLKCLPGHSHEWYREDEVETKVYNLWTGNVYRITDQIKRKTCINCWRVVETRRREPYRGWRDRPKVLKKRPIDLVRGW